MSRMLLVSTTFTNVCPTSLAAVENDAFNKLCITLVMLVSLCRFVQLQTLQDISAKRVYSAAGSFLFIVLINALLQENTDWMSIYTLAGKKTLDSAKLCRDFAKGLFRSLLEI